MRVTSKGQVTIPKPIRVLLGILEGSEVEFDLAPDGRVYLVKADDFERNLTVVRSVAGTADGGLSTAEIMRMTRGEDWIEGTPPATPPDPKRVSAILKAHEDSGDAERGHS